MRLHGNREVHVVKAKEVQESKFVKLEASKDPTPVKAEPKKEEKKWDEYDEEYYGEYDDEGDEDEEELLRKAAYVTQDINLDEEDDDEEEEPVKLLKQKY